MTIVFIRAIAMSAAMLPFFSTALAASFDCGKARRPIEKLICSNPELDAADTRMGEVFKQVNAGFPLKGFLPVTQRVFLSGYPYCMNDNLGKPLPRDKAASRCAALVKDRIAELEQQSLARVYSNASNKFTHDNLAILAYTAEGRKRIRLWGNWMPDAYDPKPFPDGILCDIDEELKTVNGSYTIHLYEEVVFGITDAAVTISEHIICTPRTGIGAGTYRRVH